MDSLKREVSINVAEPAILSLFFPPRILLPSPTLPTMQLGHTQFGWEFGFVVLVVANLALNR